MYPVQDSFIITYNGVGALYWGATPVTDTVAHKGETAHKWSIHCTMKTPTFTLIYW